MTTLPDSQSIPVSLLDRPQWVCWREEPRDGTATKIPVDPHTGGFASATDPETWATFDVAYDHADRAELGLGFVFTEADPFVGIDLDKCRVPATETTTEWAGEIIDRLDSYTELSPSGTGYHVIVAGALPPGGNRRGDVEMYAHSRYFTVTGEHVDGTPTTIEERSQELASVHSAYVLDDPADGPDSKDSRVDLDSEGPPERDSGIPHIHLDDETLLARARRAKNGAKFDRLFGGSTAGYDSHSEADMALCALLAFWSGGDATQMDRLFRASGLYREKWDEKRFADGSTYGEKTIERAIAGTTEFYAPGLQGGDGSTAISNPGVTPQRSASPRPRVTVDSSSVTDVSTIESLSSHISDLERENDTLRAQLEAERADRRVLEAQLDSEGASTSLWRRLIGRGGASDSVESNPEHGSQRE